MRISGAILAAGRGERMRIDIPKPIFPLLGRPMITFPLQSLNGAGVSRPVIVTSAGGRKALKPLTGTCPLVVQPRPRGTGDAVNLLRRTVRGRGTLVVINADSPLFETVHVRALLRAHLGGGAQVSFATANVVDPSGLGRVLRDPTGQLANIVEESEASPEAKRVREINAGLYAFEVPVLFDLLAAIKPVGPRREVYLTRAVELAIARGLRVTTVPVPAEASFGVNTLAEAAQAQAVLQARKLAALMAAGVIIDDPSRVTVDWDVSVGAGSRLLPETALTARTRVGPGCTLGPAANITDASIGRRVRVRSSWISASRIDDGAEIGPYANIRPHCRVRRGAKVGTHAEIVRTQVGERARMGHFSYLGDTILGAGANVGAGAVVANYDGRRKSASRIGRDAFVGSGAVLVAPAAVGDRAVIGAGAVVPAGRRVPAGAVVAGVPARPVRPGRSRRA